MNFPVTRLRRLRRTEAMRSLVRETHLHPGALIYPLFICPGENIRKEIGSMPGVFNLSIDEAVKEAEACAALGIGGLLLFGLPAEKDEQATGAWAEDGVVQQALRALKKNRALDRLVVIADVCLCEYTSHGHCGVVARDGEHYDIENDSSVALIAKTAASLARAGADIVAPSDMMDGRVEAIREALDAGGHEQRLWSTNYPNNVDSGAGLRNKRAAADRSCERHEGQDDQEQQQTARRASHRVTQVQRTPLVPACAGSGPTAWQGSCVGGMNRHSTSVGSRLRSHLNVANREGPIMEVQTKAAARCK